MPIKLVNQMDIQAVADMEFVDRLDKRIYDLQLSRQIAIQTAPQIRYVKMLIKRWLRKFKVLYLQVFRFGKSNGNCPYVNETARNAVSAQRAVTDTTNDLLTQNAAMLKQNAIETATRKIGVAL